MFWSALNPAAALRQLVRVKDTLHSSSRLCVDRRSGVRVGRRRMADETSDTPPDRLSLDPRSAHFDEALLEAAASASSSTAAEKTNVMEYCVSEGWIRVAAGRSRDRYGQPMTLKLKGKVEPYFDPKSGLGQDERRCVDEG